MVSIKIAGTVDDSIVDGEGYRFTIFTQGCPHNCPGCHNPQTHDCNKGKLVDADDLIQRIKQNPLLSGVTFSGGEPFLQPLPLNYIAEKIHTLSLDLTIYTGYTLEQLQDMHNAAIDKLLSLTDTLIDGRFLLEQRDLTLTFRGSRNQRIIDMNASRQQNKIVLKLLD
ncbi:anaerobic ribonucleoside-triphosphate reductase activating protein [Pectinatus brassicae]|uniref:Anaerobic ribonucleoside-triphosphate reductase-activating protein n=1 Tax=Pectinatus brassicae TaxID=862415 RepID=A0A840UL15_9FIRM|nr:anaerobic ribonucleoside-triphosphate reductase activating protein [Pectinatus brassicae]MBB5334932.1 anaerobic ribonucleoside-triphosphate reductase activating protein [Pectinatus brassicae]